MSKPINSTQNHSAPISLDKRLVVMVNPGGRGWRTLLYVEARSKGVTQRLWIRQSVKVNQLFAFVCVESTNIYIFFWQSGYWKGKVLPLIQGRNNNRKSTPPVFALIVVVNHLSPSLPGSCDHKVVPLISSRLTYCNSHTHLCHTPTSFPIYVSLSVWE